MGRPRLLAGATPASLRNDDLNFRRERAPNLVEDPSVHSQNRLPKPRFARITIPAIAQNLAGRVLTARHDMNRAADIAAEGDQSGM